MTLQPKRLGRQLDTLVGLLIVGCLVYFAFSRGSVFQDVPEIIIPITISVGLVMIALWVREQELVSDQLERIVTFGWVGAIASALTSGWWVVVQMNRGSPLMGVGDQFLTLWSFGIGAGVVLGAYAAASYDHEQSTDRDCVLAEEVWSGREEPDPIASSIVEAIADLEGVGPLELEPLYDDIDPDVFEKLRERGGTQWQLRFYTDEYEIRVSSQGVVTVLDSPVSTQDGVVVPVT